MPIDLPNFRDGETLNATALNSLYRAVAEVAAAHGLRLTPAITWVDGEVLIASDLNCLLTDIEAIYHHIHRPVPSWSFGRFESGRVLRASHLNELVEHLRNLAT